MTRHNTWGLVGAIGTISALTICARLFGFMRWLAQSAWVGTGSFANAYATANQIPNVFYEVVAGGALAGITIPLLSAPLAKGRTGEVSRLASALLTWSLILLIPLGAVVAIAAPQIVGVLPTPKGTDAQLQAQLMTVFLRVFAPQIPLYGICVVLTGILQAHEKFFFPALAPLLSSIVVLVTYGIFGQLCADPDLLTHSTGWEVQLLAWGTTGGVVALSLPLFIPVRRLGVRLRLVFRIPREQAKQAFGLAVAGVSTLVAQQISVLAVLLSARNWGGEGTLPIYQCSQAVYFLPYAILAVPVATALFPLLNRGRALGNQQGFVQIVAWSTGLVGLVSMGGTALVWAEAFLAQSLFHRLNPVPGMAVGLLAMAPGVFGLGLMFHLTRVLYALNRPRIIIWWTSLAWGLVSVLSIGLCWLAAFNAAWGPEISTMLGLVLAQSVGMLVGAGGMLSALIRLAGGEIWRIFAKCVFPWGAVCLAFGLGLMGLFQYRSTMDTPISHIIPLAVGVAVLTLAPAVPFMTRLGRQIKALSKEEH